VLSGCCAFQDLASLRVDAGTLGSLTVLGHIRHKLLCIPDLKALLDPSWSSSSLPPSDCCYHSIILIMTGFFCSENLLWKHLSGAENRDGVKCNGWLLKNLEMLPNFYCCWRKVTEFIKKSRDCQQKLCTVNLTLLAMLIFSSSVSALYFRRQIFT